MPTHSISSAPSRLSRRFRLTSLAFATVLSALAACGGSDDAPTAPAPDGGSGPTAPAPGGENSLATLTVTNQTANHTASFVRTRSCGGGTWGDDILGGADYLEKGETVSTQLPAGCYDVRVTPKENDVTFLYIYGVQLATGQTEALTFTAFPAK